jgi:hypothetical protein
MAAAFEPGVPLSHYRQHGAGVLLTCLDCLDGRTFELEAVIGRLAARQVGGEQTGIRELSRLVRAPCRRCGARRFECRPDFPPPRQDPGLAYEGPRGA